jgi:hypothetical protein
VQPEHATIESHSCEAKCHFNSWHPTGVLLHLSQAAAGHWWQIYWPIHGSLVTFWCSCCWPRSRHQSEPQGHSTWTKTYHEFNLVMNILCPWSDLCLFSLISSPLALPQFHSSTAARNICTTRLGLQRTASFTAPPNVRNADHQSHSIEIYLSQSPSSSRVCVSLKKTGVASGWP